MTFIRSYTTEKLGGNNRRYVREVIELLCDECGSKYECQDRYKIRARNNSLHFCSFKCSSKSLVSGKLRVRTFDALVVKYGGYFTSTEEFKKGQEEACLSLYGVKSRLQADSILSKIKLTNINRYGRPTFAGSKQHLDSCDYMGIARKAWETKIRNGSCSRSIPEEKMYTMLAGWFGIDNVKRQVMLVGQWVDFYVSSINTYIQVDGVYWHGLNRSLGEVSLCRTAQDKKIYRQMLRDHKLNLHCASNQINLVRITDGEINHKTEVELHSLLLISEVVE